MSAWARFRRMDAGDWDDVAWHAACDAATARGAGFEEAAAVAPKRARSRHLRALAFLGAGAAAVAADVRDRINKETS